MEPIADQTATQPASQRSAESLQIESPLNTLTLQLEQQQLQLADQSQRLVHLEEVCLTLVQLTETQLLQQGDSAIAVARIHDRLNHLQMTAASQEQRSPDPKLHSPANSQACWRFAGWELLAGLATLMIGLLALYGGFFAQPTYHALHQRLGQQQLLLQQMLICLLQPEYPLCQKLRQALPAAPPAPKS